MQTPGALAAVDPSSERVTVALSYVETLKYDEGTYEFSFPTVVGPRYVPGAPAGALPQGGGRLSDTDRVPDASRISPRVMPEGMRAGHDISIDVALDAGLPVGELKSVSHEIEVERTSPTAARVRLKDSAAIPNKDFVLRYDVAGRKIEDALLTHRDSRGGYLARALKFMEWHVGEGGTEMMKAVRAALDPSDSSASSAS